MWGKQQGGIFIRWRVIGLGLWVQIGTADGGKCFAVDAALSMVGGARWGMQKLGHTLHALPITSGRRAAVEGKEGSDITTLVVLSTGPEMGLSSG